MRVGPLPLTARADVYRDGGDVRCPACFGIPELVVEHRPSPGVVVRILYGCATCMNAGCISRASSRRFWAAKPPTA